MFFTYSVSLHARHTFSYVLHGKVHTDINGVNGFYEKEDVVK